MHFYFCNLTDNKDVRCYGVYGCFPLDGPWITKQRPDNYHPMSPDEIKPIFPVFTYRSQNDPQYININDPFGVTEMGINPRGIIYFITHGFLDTGKNLWVRV